VPELVTVTVTAGRLGGSRSGAVRSFFGIPYARTTAGDGRFGPPRPHPGWLGVREARDYGPACPQPPIRDNLVITAEVQEAMFALADEPQDEDCLSLNVWTPATTARACLPVMVSLHGGGFKSGSGSARSAPWFDGTRLADGGDVVVVTVNHRVGVLGHLHVAGVPGSANAGLLDLVAALEWVRDNIAAFGGDPRRVTIFGESGGGGKVMALLTMPHTAGLIHGAISQSATMEWMSTLEASAVAAAVEGELGVQGGDALRRVPVGELVQAALTVARAGLRFAPVIDDVVLTAPVADALASGAGASVPAIIGFTRDEASAFLGPPSDPPPADWAQRVRAGTDAMFRGPAMTAAAARAGRGGACTYVYEFAWETPVLGGRLGAAHGVDVAFPLDNTELHPATRGSETARALARVVRDAWVALARDGDPNHPGLVPWAPFDPVDGAILVLGRTPRVQRRPPGVIAG
jgi:para-nitrobenzyl esterase